MKTNSLLLLALVALPFTTVCGQVMPQDNWRYDGLSFSAPDPTHDLKSIATGSGGVYVGTTGSTSSILHFTENGVYVGQFGTLADLEGLACDSGGNVYALDTGDAKVKVYGPTGTFVREWALPGGTGNGQFTNLASYGDGNLMAIDRSDAVYICDPGNSRVQLFDGTGNFLRTIGSFGTLPSQFRAGQPGNIAIGGKDLIYCSDYTADIILVFMTDGSFVNTRNNSNYLYGGIAASSDNIIAIPSNFAFYSDLFDEQNRSIQVSIGSGVTPTFRSRSRCFDRRGNHIILSEQRAYVFEREYAGVENSLVPPAIPQPVVLATAQRDGQPWLDVDYQVTDADSPAVATAALAFLAGGNTLADVVPIRTLVDGTDGNLGAAMAANVPHRFTWNMAADWSVDFAQIHVEVLAKDDRDPLGFHWITVPEDGALPELQVSKDPLNDARLLSYWYWLIATGDSDISFANGEVRGANGIYTGQLLASGAATTNLGRAMAYVKLGIRAATPGEVYRAGAGNYGFGTNNEDTVVLEALPPSGFVTYWGDIASRLSMEPTSHTVAAVTGSGANIVGRALLLFTDGSVGGWGDTNNVGAEIITQIPPDLSDVVKVSAADVYSNSHAFALRSDGSIIGWGNNGSGQLNVPAISGSVVDVDAGNSFSLAVDDTGQVYAWGTTSNGVTNVPAGLNDATKVAAGYSFGLALRSNGTVTGWGSNATGSLDIPPGLSGVVEIEAGNSYAAALKSDGTVVTWGSSTLAVPAGLTDVVQIAAGESHMVALKADGTVVAWGSNNQGQTDVPPGLANVVAVGAGGGSSMAIIAPAP